MKRNLLATAVGLLLASTAGATILEWSPEEKRVYFEKREAFANVKLRHRMHFNCSDRPIICHRQSVPTFNLLW